MKHLSSVMKTKIIVLLLVFTTGALLAAPDVEAQLRLYEGFKVDASTPARVITSYYLKPISTEDVFSEVEITKEEASLKRVFNLKDIKIITQAHLVLKTGKQESSFQVIVLNGRQLTLKLTAIEGQKNRFKVEVVEEGKKKPLLETNIQLPEKKTTVLGFDDSAGKTYFLSFHRGVDKNYPVFPTLKVTEDKKPKLIKSVSPKYPEEAIKKHISGKVIVNAGTDKHGKVIALQVQEGHPLLRQAALKALKEWQYDPYIVDGQPKPVQFTVVIKFNLDKKQKPQKPISVPGNQKPRLIKQVQPKYPEDALKAKIQGKVTIEATTDTKGKVIQAEVISGPQMLRSAALTAIKQWQYDPYILDGKPKPVRFTVVIKFSLNKKECEDAINISAKNKPRLLHLEEPKYPVEAMKAHKQAQIVLEATTDVNGKVISAEIIDGDPQFNQAAVDALKKWKYEPYIINGKAKCVKFTVIIKFKLNKKK